MLVQRAVEAGTVAKPLVWRQVNSYPWSPPPEDQSGPVVALRHRVGCGQPQDGVATKVLSTGDVALKIAPFFYLGCLAVYHAGCIAVDIRKRFKVNLTLVEGLT